STELDRGKREAILHRIQQLMHEKVMYAPLLELAIPGGYGPRVAESAIGLIPNMSSSDPYEELPLNARFPRTPLPLLAAQQPKREARAHFLLHGQMNPDHPERLEQARFRQRADVVGLEA